MEMLFADLKALISSARSSAEREAKTGCAIVKSRGVWLRALKGEECLNDPEVDFVTTKASVDAFVKHWADKSATEIYIEGGFDGGDRIKDWDDHYQPYVSDWALTIWEEQLEWLSAEVIEEDIAQNAQV